MPVMCYILELLLCTPHTVDEQQSYMHPAKTYSETCLDKDAADVCKSNAHTVCHRGRGHGELPQGGLHLLGQQCEGVHIHCSAQQPCMTASTESLKTLCSLLGTSKTKPSANEKWMAF